MQASVNAIRPFGQAKVFSSHFCVALLSGKHDGVYVPSNNRRTLMSDCQLGMQVNDLKASVVTKYTSTNA